MRDKTTQEIASLFDVDPSTVLNWTKDGLPCDKTKGRKQSNRYDEAEVAAWTAANHRTGKMGRPVEPEGDELKQIKIRKEMAMALKYERENKIAEGKLIDAAAEQERDVQKIAHLRNRLCGLGATISPQMEGLDGAERQTIIDEAIEHALRDFANGYQHE